MGQGASTAAEQNVMPNTDPRMMQALQEMFMMHRAGIGPQVFIGGTGGEPSRGPTPRGPDSPRRSGRLPPNPHAQRDRDTIRENEERLAYERAHPPSWIHSTVTPALRRAGFDISGGNADIRAARHGRLEFS